MIKQAVALTLPLRLKIIKALVNWLSPTVYDSISCFRQTRPMMAYVKHNLGKRLVGVEIGVDQGLHAESMLLNLSIKQLYAVDPFCEYFDFINREMQHFSYVPSKKIAVARLARFKNVVWRFMKSTEAAPSIPDNLDFVYIDGCHTYDAVKEDIATYYLKVRCGGVLGGHDFTQAGVFRAVSEFVLRYDLTILTGDVDWWVVKP